MPRGNKVLIQLIFLDSVPCELRVNNTPIIVLTSAGVRVCPGIDIGGQCPPTSLTNATQEQILGRPRVAQWGGKSGYPHPRATGKSWVDMVTVRMNSHSPLSCPLPQNTTNTFQPGVSERS